MRVWLVVLSAVALAFQSVPTPRELRQGDESNVDAARQVRNPSGFGRMVGFSRVSRAIVAGGRRSL